MTVAIGDKQVPGHGTPVGVQSAGFDGFVSATPGPDEPEVQVDAADDSEPDATEAAVAKAEELDVDLADVEGTGKDGRVTAEDVESAAAASE